MRVGYLGPEGTVSHEALRSAAGSFEEVPQPTLEAAVLAVRDGTVDRALVPIENALEGSVDPVLDALVFHARELVIVGELRHPVHFCLVAAGPVDLGEVAAVVSHPQASGQCASFLREALPHAHIVSASSTADAVRRVAAEPGLVGLGTRQAAELYGCVILRENVEDHPDNETRFVWLAPAGAEPAPGDRFKTALLFWGSGSSGPGWLVRCLAEFAERDVNLTRIESRPLRQRLGEYMFFLDLDGGVDDPEVAAAVSGLRSHADVVRVLGSFPAA
ncbi:MAG TPA: prephenate dehydratase [Solirubrobacteraceae bacterium]|jgi:prephenate dehydratase|nr:prephenate dehydratase [Solirubrobacteraceae bacterium]